MASYGIQFDDIPAYVDQTWADGQEPHMQGSAATGSDPESMRVLRTAALIIALAVIALWAMGYWFKKG